jgi:hypothetical protein
MRNAIPPSSLACSRRLLHKVKASRVQRSLPSLCESESAFIAIRGALAGAVCVPRRLEGAGGNL